MEHSDELTFADYFNAEKEIYRNITCAALAARWLLDHGFVMPTDAEIKELVAEANRKVLEAWGETAKCWKHGARFTRLPC